MMDVFPLPLMPTMTVRGEKKAQMCSSLSEKERIPRMESSGKK